MIKRRGFILALLFLFALIGSTTAVIYWRFTNLPHPREASHSQLMYWVVLRDLDQYDQDVRLALVNRFADEAAEIFEKNVSSDVQLSPAQSQRLLHNIDLLKQVWFEDRISQYCDIRNPQACEFYLQKQIALLDQFGNIAFKHARLLYPDKSSEMMTTISDELLADIDKWLEETPADKKEQTLQAVREATVFWLATQDLKEQVMDARKELAKRVVAELDNGLNLKKTTGFVSPARLRVLKQNAMLLVEAWMHLLADEYAQLPADRKQPFIDGIIRSVKRWQLLEFIANDPSTSSPTPTNPLTGMMEFRNTVQIWIDRADPQMKPRLKRLSQAIQQRALFSLLQPGSTSGNSN